MTHNVNVNVNDNDNDSDTENDNAKDNDNDNDNDTDNDNDNVNIKDKDKDKFLNLIGEKHQRGKHNSKENPSNNISINFYGSPQSWLHDEDIIVNAAFPENFRCIIIGPSECGKTFFLKELIMSNIYFDKLHIIGPTGDQNEGIEVSSEVSSEVLLLYSTLILTK